MSDTTYRPRTHWGRLFRMYDAAPNRYACEKRQMDADALAEQAEVEREQAEAEAVEYSAYVASLWETRIATEQERLCREAPLFYSSERGLYRHAE